MQLTVDGGGICKKVGIDLTNVGATPVKASKAEESLRGTRLDEDAIARASQLASDEAQPSSDLRGPAEYKKGLVKELTRRALARAYQRAGK